MGRLILPKTGRVYVDANTVIYRIESLEPFTSASAPLWEALQSGDCEVMTSELTLLETLVKPLADNNLALVVLYRKILLKTAALTCFPVDRDTLEFAATLRATHRLKTSDSIHAATAILSGASLFVTNDGDFRKVGGLNVVLLSEVAAS